MVRKQAEQQINEQSQIPNNLSLFPSFLFFFFVLPYLFPVFYNSSSSSHPFCWGCWLWSLSFLSWGPLWLITRSREERDMMGFYNVVTLVDQNHVREFFSNRDRLTRPGKENVLFSYSHSMKEISKVKELLYRHVWRISNKTTSTLIE